MDPHQVKLQLVSQIQLNVLKVIFLMVSYQEMVPNVSQMQLNALWDTSIMDKPNGQKPPAS
jgi:hypothetical protein